MNRKSTLALAAAAALAALVSSPVVAADAAVIGLITKTDTNPFFVKMKEGAEKAAKAQGAKLMSAAGKKDGDNAAQVAAIENMVAKGVKTILITPSDAKAIIPSIKKAQDKGVMVIALDSPTDPESAVDALFATNNYKAGELIGQYAKAAMAGKPAKIATLDLFPGHPVGAQRHNGFLKGFGLAANDAKNNELSKPSKWCAWPTPTATRPRARPRWKTACKRTPTSMWSTPSMSRLLRVPTTH